MLARNSPLHVGNICTGLEVVACRYGPAVCIIVHTTYWLFLSVRCLHVYA